MQLTATPYHLKVRDYFRKQEKTWNFFAAAATKKEQLAQFKTELLKNTYKFDPTADSTLFESLTKAKSALALDHLPVAVYQAQYTDELNASIVYLEGEAHIVFSGRITQLMDERELLAVLAHELSHVKLYSMLDGDLEIADRIITAIANNHNSEAVYYETARLYRLYTEIFCDRGASLVLGDISPIITSLVKTATGLDKVSADSYINQAEEIFSSDAVSKNLQFSHPENFIRARALKLWSSTPERAEEEIIRMIEGLSELDQLDIFQQQKIHTSTRLFLQLLLKPKWFRTSTVLSLARQFYPDFTIQEDLELNKSFSELMAASDKSLKEYFAYVLLDFANADQSLEEVPFGWCYQFSEDLQLKVFFETIVKKELKFSEKKLAQHRQKSLDAYYEVKESDQEQIYGA